MKYTRKRRRSKRRTKLRGGFGDSRYSFLPTPLSDMITNIQHSIMSSTSTLSGSYPGVDPSWRIQPLR
jgi:hypothetical protein